MTTWNDEEAAHVRLLEGPRSANIKIGAHFSLQPSQEPPSAGYRSWDGALIYESITTASDIGIDFLVLDYRPEISRHDARYELFLRSTNIADIQFCVFYRCSNPGELDPTAALAELTEITERFMQHPCYLKVDGRPVLLVSRLPGLTEQALADWKEQVRRAGHDVFLILDGMAWDEPSKQGSVKRAGADLGIESFDGLTGYSLFHEGAAGYQGYAGTTGIVEDLNSLTSSLRSSPGYLPVLPCVIPGFKGWGRESGEHQAVIARSLFKNSKRRLFHLALRTYALPQADPDVPLVFIRSWNEWLDGTAIAFAGHAPPTVRDKLAEEDFSYKEFLAVYHLSVAITGRVLTKRGLPLPGQRVTAWRGTRPVATARSNTRGVFRFSTSNLPPGAYRVGLTLVDSVPVRVAGRQPVAGLRFFGGGEEGLPEAASPNLEPIALLTEGLEDYLSEFPLPSTIERVGKHSFYPGDGEDAGVVSETFAAELERLLGPGDTVVEVGAKEGRLSMNLSERVGTDGRVYALESNLESYRRLFHNLRLNLCPNVVGLHFELGAFPGTASNGAGDSSKVSELVETRTLDSFGFPQLQLLCLRKGTSGTAAVSGASRSLIRTRASVIFEDQEPEDLIGSSAILAPLGYQFARTASGTTTATWVGEGPDRIVLDVGDFASQPNLLTGFSGLEFASPTSFVWSSARLSELAFPLEKASAGAYLLGIRAKGLAELCPLEAEVRVNDVALDKLLLGPDWEVLALEVPPGVLHGGENRVTFRFSKTGKPAQLAADSHDTRALAMALDVVWAVPANPRPSE